MKKLIYIFIGVLVGCSSNTSSIKLKIEKELGHDINNGIVLLISENNCISCFKDNLYSWIDFADTSNIQVTSLFYCSGEYPLEFKKLMKDTDVFIDWQKTTSLKLFELSSKLTNQKSPFVLLYKDNEIKYFAHLTPVDYYLNIK